MNLSTLIEQAIDKRLREIPQTLVCTVESFDKDKMTASVKPLYYSVDSKGKKIAYPLLTKIPVASPFYGKDIHIKPSYKKGDLVLVACGTFDFSQQIKKQIAPESVGLFGKENSVLICGLKSSSDAIKDMNISFEDNKILIKNGSNAKIEVSDANIILQAGPTGKIEVTSSEVKFTTAAGTNNWSTHTAIGNLGAPTSPPTPGT